MHPQFKQRTWLPGATNLDFSAFPWAEVQHLHTYFCFKVTYDATVLPYEAIYSRRGTLYGKARESQLTESIFLSRTMSWHVHESVILESVRSNLIMKLSVTERDAPLLNLSRSSRKHDGRLNFRRDRSKETSPFAISQQ